MSVLQDIKKHGALMLMFSIYLGKIGISLHMKDIEPDARQLYRLRAFFFKKKKERQR
jgi:hypothetical protein